MTSPVVWDDALARAQAACASLGLTIEQPNAQYADHGDMAMWALIEASTGTSDRIELDGAIWEEDGQILLHVMAAKGTGARDAIVARKQLALAFRAPDSLPPGLVYLGMAFDPGNLDDAGNWTRFGLTVDYRYQDLTGAA